MPTSRQTMTAKELIEKIKPFLESTKKSNLFPCGLKLADLPELINLFKKSFDKDLPGFEDWNLHSNGWMAYQDDLMDLPNAGSRWSNYRRRGSEVYTDNAIDENVFDARNEFVDSLSSTLRSLSEHYRGVVHRVYHRRMVHPPIAKWGSPSKATPEEATTGEQHHNNNNDS